MVLKDLFAFMLEVEVIINAEWRILSDVHAQLTYVALLSDLEAVTAYRLVMDVELEDFLLFCRLHSQL
jgi:hypothetical protein